jgi:regulatory subunit for Cdc7p protein kinase
MATLSRRPLAPRTLHLQIPAVIPQLKAGTFSGPNKRARSPEIAEDSAPQATPPKRARGTHPSPAPPHQPACEAKDRERRRAEREAQKAEFRIKYTRAFPGWVFYFDLDILDPESAASRRTLESKVSSLGAVRFVVLSRNLAKESSAYP